MKLSIITINFNNREGLRKTLASIRTQSEHCFEYIVIDGGSTDGGLEEIKKNLDIIDCWVSESDRGIYHAMNKGVERARGEYCLFLNSGDILSAEDVATRFVAGQSNADIIFGNVVNVYPDGRRRLYIPSEEMTLLRIMETGIHHAGSFIKRELMLCHPYDEKYKICSDRKFFIQSLVIDNCNFSRLGFEVCDFELGGISYTNTDLARKESWRIMEELFPPRLVADYRKTNLRIQTMTAKLVKCRHKIIELITRLDEMFIRIFRLILGKRVSRKD